MEASKQLPQRSSLHVSCRLQFCRVDGRIFVDSRKRWFCPNDKGAYLNSSQHVEHSAEPDGEYGNGSTPLCHIAERKLIYKVDGWVIPILCVLYFLAFLDR